MFKISTTSNLAFIFSFALKLILLVAIVTNTLMVLTFTIYLNGLNGQILIKEKSAGVTTLKKYSNFTIDLYTKVPQNLKSIEHIDLNLIHVNETTNTKIILFVNNEANTVGRKGVTYPKSYFVSRCKIPCLVTNDKDYLGEGNIDQFDALIFKIRFFKTDEKAKAALPSKRSLKQRYILSTHESSRWENIPSFVNDNFLSIDFYNWTWTYRWDSDIVESYGPVIAKKNETPLKYYRKKDTPKGILKSTHGKSKLVFWTVSHCKTDNYRERYVESLQKYINVDIFGACSGNECPRKLEESCFASVGHQYWFYLAFENSNCPDYITEKLWRMLDSNIVPVVMGGGNYKRDAPYHSLIDVNDFHSVKDLADYLIYLTENPEEYLKYFEWKNDYVFYFTDPYCTLCYKLHDLNEPPKMYSNMTDWFYYDSNGNLLCTDGSERDYFQSITV